MDYWLSPCSPTEEQRDLWSEGSGEFQMKEDPAGESPMGGKGAEGKKLVFVETPSLGEQQQPATEHAEMETEVELSTSAKEEESVATSVSSTDGPGPECYDEMRSLFHRAYLLLNPSALFRFATYLFAERKLVVFFWMHFLSTMIIWRKYQ